MQGSEIEHVFPFHPEGSDYRLGDPCAAFLVCKIPGSPFLFVHGGKEHLQLSVRKPYIPLCNPYKVASIFFSTISMTLCNPYRTNKAWRVDARWHGGTNTSWCQVWPAAGSGACWMSFWGGCQGSIFLKRLMMNSLESFVLPDRWGLLRCRPHSEGGGHRSLDPEKYNL